MGSIGGQLEERGFVLVRRAVRRETCERLRDRLPAVPPRRGGVRLPLDEGPVREALGKRRKLRRLAEEVLGEDCFAVKAILFDKTTESNWPVGLHQDKMIAVAERHELAGFRSWSVKEGVPHVQPPIPVLEAMVTLRLHLDEVGEFNGPLIVQPGSHRYELEKPPTDLVEQVKLARMALKCCAKVGDVLVMRPLIWHASGRADAPTHRRVLHVEFAATELPHPLAWYERC